MTKSGDIGEISNKRTSRGADFKKERGSAEINGVPKRDPWSAKNSCGLHLTFWIGSPEQLKKPDLHSISNASVMNANGYLNRIADG